MGLFDHLKRSWQANVINGNGIDEITISRFTYDAWQKCAMEDDLSYQAYEGRPVSGKPDGYVPGDVP